MVAVDHVVARRVRWWPLVAVLAVVAFLAGGWLLINSWLDDTEPVADGAALAIGPEPDRPASVTVSGDGWTMDTSASDPDQSYQLARDGVALTVTYVRLASPQDARDLWSGLRTVTEVGGGTLGPPRPATTTAGRKGQSGPVTLDGKAGTAYAFPAPDRTFAIELTAVAPAGAPDPARAAAEQTIRSLRFHEDSS